MREAGTILYEIFNICLFLTPLRLLVEIYNPVVRLLMLYGHRTIKQNRRREKLMLRRCILCEVTLEDRIKNKFLEGVYK